jgi:hypothetical protein
MILSLLDKPIAALKRAIPSLSLGELEVLKKAEEDGKTRVGAIAVIEEAIAEIEAEPGEEWVENIVPGLDITLHDRSHLLFGQRALVPSDLAALLRERGQVA